MKLAQKYFEPSGIVVVTVSFSQIVLVFEIVNHSWRRTVAKLGLNQIIRESFGEKIT